jgi:hypothetical protein
MVSRFYEIKSGFMRGFPLPKGDPARAVKRRAEVVHEAE